MSAKPMAAATRERGILFKDRLVRAILEGRKTQTRRLVKWEPIEPGLNIAFTGLSVDRLDDAWALSSRGEGGLWNQRTKSVRCPFGVVGDVLWVREAWTLEDGKILFRSSKEAWVKHHTWKPGIHLHRVNARIDLEVTAVRIERLKSITEEDARAEGVPFNGTYWLGAAHEVKGTPKCHPTARDAFAELWNSVNGERASWESNPWIWVVTFRRTKP